MMDPTTESTHRPLGLGAAFARQFRLLWSSRRPLLLGVGVLALLVLSGDPWSDGPMARLLKVSGIAVVLAGPIWAFGVFHNEGPGKRMYLWSLPVGRAEHVWARLLAGLAWLWIVFAVMVAAGVAMAALDGDLWQLGRISAAGWLNFFTGPTLGYLAVSILTVASDYPIRWFFGILFLLPLLVSILDEWLSLEAVARVALEPLANSDWGLAVVMVGAIGADVQRVSVEVLDMAGHGALVVDYWWLATPLWILLLSGLVGFAATRHPDTLPRLRRPR